MYILDKQKHNLDSTVSSELMFEGIREGRFSDDVYNQLAIGK
jgi:hypothetical protein